MEASGVKIIFLDIGGILLSNGWGHESRQKAAETFGFDYAEMDVLHHFIFTVYEIGRISLDDYLDTVIFNRTRDFTKENLREFIFSQSAKLPDMLHWFKEWKLTCDFRVISINNEGKELNDYRIKTFGLHQCFDAFVSCCEVGMRKPDPGIFKLAMGIAQASPQECVYFDDRPLLVQAAQKLGIQSFHHQGFSSTRIILEGLKNKNNGE